MTVLYICSSESYSGKSVACLILGRHYQALGKKVGYFKPVGTLPIRVGNITTDEDAYFVSKELKLTDPVESICPVLLTSETVNHLLDGREEDFVGQVEKAFEVISKDKDIVIMGGVGSAVSTGMILGLSAQEVVSRLKAKAVMMGSYIDKRSVDLMLAAKAALGDNLAGVLVNRVSFNQIDFVKTKIVPFLESRNLPVFGVIPRDPLLHSMSVRELAEAINAKILCCEEALDPLIEHFTVGAMNVESALRYFQRTSNKAVITGGDRSDIQLAALETCTRCIILTGDLPPDARILARAQQAGVPLLLTREDTLSTVERIEKISGKLRIREPQKIKRAEELVDEHVDFARFNAVLGLA